MGLILCYCADNLSPGMYCWSQNGESGQRLRGGGKQTTLGPNKTKHNLSLSLSFSPSHSLTHTQFEFKSFSKSTTHVHARADAHRHTHARTPFLGRALSQRVAAVSWSLCLSAVLCWRLISEARGGWVLPVQLTHAGWPCTNAHSPRELGSHQKETGFSWC